MNNKRSNILLSLSLEIFVQHFFYFRIQIGDQIIEVDDQSLVGVTHTHATSVLKATSGLVR